MQATRFTCGEHAGKTYEEVAKTDLEFCRRALEFKLHPRLCPIDFRRFLLSGGTYICEPTIEDFARRMTASMRAEFDDLVGSARLRFKRTVVHKATKDKMANELLVETFYRCYFAKCVSNVKGEEARDALVESYASTFPFRTNATLPAVVTLPIYERYTEDDFWRPIRSFVRYHFQLANCRPLVDRFLANVYDFKARHFGEATGAEILKFLEFDTSSVQLWGVDYLAAAARSRSWLRTYWRLDEVGARWYEFRARAFNRLADEFDKSTLAPKPRCYYRHLPEFNGYELVALLDTTVYALYAREYMRLFLKYLFFFARAVADPDHPVFVVDDVLYECLKYYVDYRAPRADVSPSQWEVWMVTLVRHRRFVWRTEKISCRQPFLDKSLRHMVRYVQAIPAVQTATVDYGEINSKPNFRIPMVVGDAAYAVRYSQNNQRRLAHFTQLMMAAAVSTATTIRKLVVYNAYRGVEYSVQMPACKREIQDFISRWNDDEYKFSPTDVLVHSHRKHLYKLEFA